MPFSFDHLPCVSKGHALLINQIAGASCEISFELAGKVATLSLDHKAPVVGSDWTTTNLTIGDKRVRVDASQDFLPIALQLLESEASVADMPPQFSGLVMDAGFAAQWTHLERILKDEVVVLSHQADQPGCPSVALSFLLRFDHQVACLRVHAPTEFLHRIVETLPTQLAPRLNRAASDIKFNVQLSSPEFQFSAQELSDIEVGDAFACDPRWTGKYDLQVLAPNKMSATAEYSPDGVRMANGLSRRTVSQSSNIAKGKAMNAHAPKSGLFDEMLVSVSLELDQIELPIATLNNLTEGSVLPFSPEIPEQARIMVNGQYFASGELIKLGEGLGVRLVDIG